MEGATSGPRMPRSPSFTLCGCLVDADTNTEPRCVYIACDHAMHIAISSCWMKIFTSQCMVLSFIAESVDGHYLSTVVLIALLQGNIRFRTQSSS